MLRILREARVKWQSILIWFSEVSRLKDKFVAALAQVTVRFCGGAIEL